LVELLTPLWSQRPTAGVIDPFCARSAPQSIHFAPVNHHSLPPAPTLRAPRYIQPIYRPLAQAPLNHLTSRSPTSAVVSPLTPHIWGFLTTSLPRAPPWLDKGALPLAAPRAMKKAHSAPRSTLD